MRQRSPQLRVGLGEDAHALASGRPLVIGGVTVPASPRGAEAHSDGDALLHALADALLGSLALGDIGHYFPPSNPAYKDLDSREIVRRVLEVVGKARPGLRILNVSGVVTLDAPKLGEKRAQIQQCVAELLGLAEEQVGIGFKTSEGLAPGFVQARVSVLVEA